MIQSGKKLSMHNEAVYKGTFTHNGTLLKVHENAFTIGYSMLLAANGKQDGNGVKFGTGVFYDASQKNNRVFAGAPTTDGAVPVFAGIITREQGYASAYPVLNDEVAPFQNGLLCKQGFVIYKKADICTGIGTSEKDTQLYGKVYPNFVMWVSKKDGSVYFSAKSTVSFATGDVKVGRVVTVNPDDESVTVMVSPSEFQDTTEIAGITPVIAADDTTDTEIMVNVSMDTDAIIKLSYKKSSGELVFKHATEEDTKLNPETGKYEVNEILKDLTPGTEYTIKAEAFSACGYKSATGTATTKGA